MIRFSIISLFGILLMASLSFMTGCGAAGDGKEFSPAEKAFRAKCRSCHSLPKPNSRTGEEWLALLAKHSDRLKLSEEKKELIKSYLIHDK